MGIEIKEKSIDGCVYQVSTLPATTGLSMMGEIAKMIGPSFGRLADSTGKDGKKSVNPLDVQIDGKVLSEALTSFSDRLDDVKVQAIIQKLAGVTLVDGKQLQQVFDDHFAGNFPSMFKWIGFALKVQFGDFLPGLAMQGKISIAKAN